MKNEKARIVKLEMEVKEGKKLNEKELIIQPGSTSFKTISKEPLFFVIPRIRERVYIFEGVAWPSKCYEQLSFRKNYYPFSKEYNKLNQELRIK